MLPRFVWWWVGLSIVGVALMALPDDDDRLFSISETHGPAPLDAAGIALALAGFGVFVAGVARGRGRVLGRATPGVLAGVAALVVAGSALTAWSVLSDAGSWWALGIAAATVGQGAVAWLAR